MKSHARLEILANVSQKRPSHEVLAKLSVWKNVMSCFTKSLPILYIHPYCPQIVRGAFQIENPRKYTWELETHNLLHISLWFSLTPTSPSPFPGEVASPNTYHTHSECKVRIWCCWKALEGAIHWWIQLGWIAGSGKLEKIWFQEASW